MHRQLTAAETDALIHNGCTAEDWRRVTVRDGFRPERVARTLFAGSVALGAFAAEDEPGAFSPEGVRDCRLANAAIGDGCRLRNATLTDVDVGDGCLIENSAVSHRPGDEPFGLTHAVHVLAEDGARQVPLWPGLSAQWAHLLCHLQTHPATDRLLAMISAWTAGVDASRSRLGPRCRVTDCGPLRAVWLGEGTVVDRAAGLDNCFAPDAPACPARILEGVRADHTVFLAASRTDGGARLSSCLVGEGVSLDRAFAAKHSLFFANSEFHLGEAACAMAGPFAVSHHKATLILACQSSFNTFGSAANSSNHHFKLGPRHGGVLRRGARCGSGSYLFWPADVGAFSTVVGKHGRHLDTADFPFSLLLERNGESVLIPGVNLFAAGMTRDGAKWRTRERRGALPRPLDLLNPAILSPYAMQAVESGIRLLRRSHNLDADLRHNGAVIPSQRIAPGLHLYEHALVFYLGEILLRDDALFTAQDFLAAVDRAAGEADAAGGAWRDWGGMLLSGHDAEAFLKEVEDGVLDSPEAVRARLESIHAAYPHRELAWAAARWRREYGAAAGALEVDAFLHRWRDAVRHRHDCLIRDVGKEFTREVMYGFGVEEAAVAAFGRIRGEPGDEALVLAARDERDRMLARADRIHCH